MMLSIFFVSATLPAACLQYSKICISERQWCAVL